MAKMDTTALFNLSYGLYVLTARDGEQDGGCIINTASQLTQDPQRITIYVNRQNQTNELIRKTGVFNVNMLTTSTPFSVFQHFGFQSGRDVDKFAGRTDPRSENGVRYLNEHCNGVLSGKVIDALDYGTHTLFVAELTEAFKLNDEPSLTYDYYFKNIKPKPQPKAKRGFICKICGYIYEGDELPPDFICPLCKHGAADFEPLV
ncbi:MAG: flavin reductase [Eubacteriales bacterium]|nr:flavin reductase [Eubacteriales bacterium]